MIAMYLQVTTALNIFESPALMFALHLVMAFYFLYEATRVHFFIGTWHGGIVLAELFVLCMLFAPASYAATVVPPPGQAMNDIFSKYVWVLFIAVLAWAASSLPVLAEWENGGGHRRLVIAQGLLQAVFFGFVAFWTSVGAGQNIMTSYIATASAAYLGERYFTFGRKSKSAHVDASGKNGEGSEQ